MSVEIPVVNNNGSSAKTMIADIRAALDALRRATGAVAATAPHPRDWQTVNDSGTRWRTAEAQHRARLRHLNTIALELEEIGVGIQGQIDR